MDKRLYIGHESAQAFWRTHGAENRRRYPQTTLATPRDACASAKALASTELDGSIVLPGDIVTLLVGSASERRATRGGIPHVWNHPCTYYQVRDGVFVASPADVALQLCDSLGFEELLLYLYELTGTYARHGLFDSTTYNREALTTVAELSNVAQNASRIRGLAKLRDAIPYTLGNSASPMESILTALLTLPDKRDGYGFEQPVLNQRIVIAETGGTRFGDLYWPKQGVDLEYQSELSHSGYAGTIRDGMRSNELVTMNNKVLEANIDHFRIPGAMERLAAQLASALGAPLPDQSISARSRRDALRRRLMAIDGVTGSRRRR